MAWYGDLPYGYTYSNTTKYALPWTKELLELKKSIERTTGEKFNSCLLNLYHNGNEGMAWHSDAEKDLVKNGAIASLSLGAERRFLFKHKLTDEKTGTFIGAWKSVGNEGCYTIQLAAQTTSYETDYKSSGKSNF